MQTTTTDTTTTPPVIPPGFPETGFDPTEPAFSDDPYPTYRWLREREPAFHWDKFGAVIIARNEQLRSMFNDPRLSVDIRNWEHYPEGSFSGERFAAWNRMLNNSLFQIGPADHSRVRRLASVALTPRRVRAMNSHIRRVVDESLDALSSDGREIVNIRDYTEIIPLNVICDIAGIPDDMRADFRTFGVSVIRSAQPHIPHEELPGIADAYTGGVALLEQLIEARRADSSPDDDLLSTFVHAVEDGQRLSVDEMLSLIFALIVAGSDTTVHGLCYAIHALLSHPAALAEVRADRSLVRAAIDESLRWNNFGKMGINRYALEPLEIAGHQVRKGQLVIGLLAASLHDPDTYEAPERYDIHRDNKQSLTFGLGRHFCLGANLARAELMIGLEALLLDRFPEAELAGPPVVDHGNQLMRPMTSLPVRLGRDHREIS